MGEVVSREELEAKLNSAREQGLKVVSTNGCFDILHVGHTRYLQLAKGFGDLLVVGVNTDASVKRLKGESRPLNNQNDRAEILSNLCSVDYVCLFDEQTPIELLKVIKPDVHVKGGDYKPEALSEKPVVESMGGRLEIVSHVPSKSTTALVAKIQGT